MKWCYGGDGTHVLQLGRDGTLENASGRDETGLSVPCLPYDSRLAFVDALVPFIF